MSRFFSTGGGEHGPYLWREAATEKDGRYVVAVPAEDSLELLYWKPELPHWEAAVAAAMDPPCTDEQEAPGGDRAVMWSYSAPVDFADWGERMDRRWKVVCETRGPLCAYRVWRGGKIAVEERQYAAAESSQERGNWPYFQDEELSIRPLPSPGFLQPDGHATT
jgi:hypothetical protein